MYEFIFWSLASWCFYGLAYGVRWVTQAPQRPSFVQGTVGTRPVEVAKTHHTDYLAFI
jgi:hypothetical protein